MGFLLGRLFVSMKLYQTITQRNLSPLFALDKLTNTHSINLKGQFFGSRKLVGLVPSPTSFFHPRIPHILTKLLLLPLYDITRVEFWTKKGVSYNFCLYIPKEEVFKKDARRVLVGLCSDILTFVQYFCC